MQFSGGQIKKNIKIMYAHNAVLFEYHKNIIIHHPALIHTNPSATTQKMFLYIDLFSSFQILF